MRTDIVQSMETTGFSDVDASGKSAELVEYLIFLADRMAQMRRQGLDLLNLEAGAAVLDVGCGVGEVCVELARRAGPHGRVAGIDLSQAMIRKAMELSGASGQEIDFRVAAVHQLPFPDRSFDVARAERLFQHLDDPEAALAEMARVTRVGGQILLVDTEHGQWSIALDLPRDQKVFEAVRRTLLRMVVNPHSGVRLRGMMQRFGLTDVRQLITVQELTLPDLRRAILIDKLVAGCVDDGSINRDEADAFISSLEARHHAGIFFANSVMYSVIGRRRA